MSTPEEHAAAIKQRQSACAHAFITSMNVCQCVHCGLSRSDYENQQAQPSIYGWSRTAKNIWNGGAT